MADPLWQDIRTQAQAALQAEPLLSGLLHTGVLHHDSLEVALASRLAQKLASREMPGQLMQEICAQALVPGGAVSAAMRADIEAVLARDPACERALEPLMFFKGFHAVQGYRVAHALWQDNRRDLALFFQMRISELFAVDIHPAAQIGGALMVDHAHGVVIGETARVGQGVSLLHSVTLGGTGKEQGQRHPHIGDGVLIGAGAKVLGNITIGACSRIAAGSVVLNDVPPCKTAAGVPARIVGEAGCDRPGESMEHRLPARLAASGGETA